MKPTWKEASLTHKIVTVFSVIVSISVVVLAILQMFDVWDKAINLCCPLLGIEMLCQAYVQWNTNRKIAYFSIGTAAFIFVCTIVVFFVK